MIRGGFLSAEDRDELIALARDGSAGGQPRPRSMITAPSGHSRDLTIFAVASPTQISPAIGPRSAIKFTAHSGQVHRHPPRFVAGQHLSLAGRIFVVAEVESAAV
jgi:hypothetical protein